MDGVRKAYRVLAQVILRDFKLTKKIKTINGDSFLAAAVAMAPFDSGFDPRQRRHLIRAQLVS